MNLLPLFALLALALVASPTATHAKDESAEPAAPSCPTNEAHFLSYDLKKGDYSCAKKNARKQQRVAPGWHYDLDSDRKNRVSKKGSEPDPVPFAWDPVLEREPGCTGLDAGWVKEFRFTVVLDRSWVRFYKKNKAAFAAQGYKSLKRSVFLSFDRVDFLFRAQFGISVRPSQVVVLPKLGDTCRADDGYADRDGSTMRALRASGARMRSTDGALLRFGARTTQCKSYMRAESKMCSSKALIVMMQEPFLDDGRVRYAAPRALAHEVAHLLGVCFDKRRGHCNGHHVADELPDIMTARPWRYGERLDNGQMYKFLTGCSPVYRDLLCGAARVAHCAHEGAPASIKGKYVAARDGAQGAGLGKVTVTERVRGRVYVWKNSAGMSWTLTRQRGQADAFDVGATCPFVRYGYTVATVRTEFRNGREVVIGIQGPFNVLYKRS